MVFLCMVKFGSRLKIKFMVAFFCYAIFCLAFMDCNIWLLWLIIFWNHVGGNPVPKYGDQNSLHYKIFFCFCIQKPIIPIDLYRAVRDSHLQGFSGYTKQVCLSFTDLHKIIMDFNLDHCCASQPTCLSRSGISIFFFFCHKWIYHCAHI